MEDGFVEYGNRKNWPTAQGIWLSSVGSSHFCGEDGKADAPLRLPWLHPDIPCRGAPFFGLSLRQSGSDSRLTLVHSEMSRRIHVIHRGGSVVSVAYGSTCRQAEPGSGGTGYCCGDASPA
jgi:hypothetical protein